MFECEVENYRGAKWLRVSDRLDGMTAPEMERCLSDLILDGERRLVLDLGKVHYVSSAGLRVLLVAHKQLSAIGGWLLLFQPLEQVAEVLRAGGFWEFFPRASSKEEVDVLLADHGADSLLVKESPGLVLRYVERDAQPGPLRVIGSPAKLAQSAYTGDDAVPVRSGDIPFAIGMAAPGGGTAGHQMLFGESVVVNGSLFSYPAVERPVVDFMLCPDPEASLDYTFLYGLGFGHDCRYVVSTTGTEGPPDLEQVVEGLFAVSRADLIGIVVIAESKGVWGMHLKRVPMRENQPQNGEEIFAPENFSSWMDFPIEPQDFGCLLVGVGIAVRDRDRAPTKVRPLLPASGRHHFHAALFSKGPLANDPEMFDVELGRVLNHMNVTKVQHLLGKSRLGNTLACVFEITP